MCFNLDDEIGSPLDKKKESPSVRVRRLMKQDFVSGTIRSEKEVSEYDKQSEPEIQTTTATEIKKNIYESIKQEIKE